VAIWGVLFFFFFNDTATTEIYTLSLHDALPISGFAGALDKIHAPNESYALKSLEDGRIGARALFEEFASLGR